MGSRADGDAAPRLYVALDTSDLARARGLAADLARLGVGVKLGKEFFTAHGPEGVRRVAGDHALFLDLKFHDIPNTVAGAVRAACRLRPWMLNVHAAGGPAMMQAAARAAEMGARETGGPRPLVLAVTVLTSLDDGDLERVGQRAPVADQVRRLAALATESGLDGVVCSPHEIATLRADLGCHPHLVVPGIRPRAASGGDDQKRTLDPAEAIQAGADALVVGRPITAAADPAAVARDLLETIAAA
jgi:orotidine-5'-phosphate decarboxylase